MPLNTSSADRVPPAAAFLYLLAQMCPGRVLLGSVAGIRRALREGVKPLYVAVIQPPLTWRDQAQVNLWVADPAFLFNVLVVVDEDAPTSRNSFHVF
jgi:hypothetical protein